MAVGFFPVRLTSLPYNNSQIPLMRYISSTQFYLVAFVPILGAILLIVPGGMGVRSSLLLLDQSGNAAQGTAFALQMIVVALGIAVGLFASTLIVYPRKLFSTVK